MKLECTVGSLSCNGIRVSAGDLFEIDEETGDHLIKHGFAVITQDDEEQGSDQEESIDDGVQGGKRYGGNAPDAQKDNTTTKKSNSKRK